MKFNTTEELIEDIAQGKMIVLLDDEDRENEGDLIMAASMVRPEDINFMARNARGLICLTLTEERCKQLNLGKMVSDNNASHGTNFTVSIEAAEGVTTGISAQDRAKTVQAAVAPGAVPRDIVQPGHIFPLMAQPGGVLSRAGHTEAGCDLARLAKLEPATVIVEIMNEDGSMSRRPDLEKFAQEHDLKIGTIEDLIHYRLRNETTVECIKSRQIETEFGEFEMRTYRDIARDQIHHAMIKGDVGNGEPCLTRVHLPTPLRDLYALIEPGTDEAGRWSLHGSMEKIANAGHGVLIILSSTIPTAKIVERQLERLFEEDGYTPPAPTLPNMQIGVGSQILRDLGVEKMLLLAAPVKYTGLAGFDLEVVDFIAPDTH
ncbi:MAG: 3,4-dihydroxy-2-butanone-4-phosphate synthase [Porticoccaceae bacterium]|jgi:3,4-dihydroxy 2-butanone 4-phosphate synthase / GTP cyclohydrolase II|nr:3,4-dihydroxy-2-butanone-4-phosphate synthase [Porticoccaceae bacterium]